MELQDWRKEPRKKYSNSALGYRSPREYLRQRACNGLSDNRCLEI